MKRFVFVSAALALGAIIDACCGLYNMSSTSAKVEFTGQTNIVLWDARNHTEHFVRSAKFKSTAKEFDFVAPTPSVPEVSVAKKAAFDYLRELTMPPRPPATGGGLGGGGAGGGGAFRGVQVYQETEVGNFHVVTLKASDATALKAWFAENNYKMSDTQDEWFDHYIKKNWFLTAFRVISDKKDIGTEAIRMSFQTNVPYNPYYVPKENWHRGAQLELFLIAESEMQGIVGDQYWTAVPQGKAVIPWKQYRIFAKDLGLDEGDLPSKMTVFRYIDYGFASGAKDDLFFYPKK
jgi:Uncharacterized protein conserved in bacteria (DUF2330)